MVLYVAILFGFILSLLLPAYTIYSIPEYEIVLYSLLAIGLYGAVVGIELQEFYKHKALILRAVTFGVLIKSLIIGAILWFVFQTPYAFLFGIIVAQIDPLSVAHLLHAKSSKFSQSGRTILRSWSSFDDPMTVLLALYIFLPLVVITTAGFSVQNYFFQLMTNIGFALGIFVFAKYFTTTNKQRLLLLGVVFVVAVYFQLMLGIALVGFFLRPTLTVLPQMIQLSFIIAAILLGNLLKLTSIHIVYGLVVGFSSFISQIVVTPLVAPGLSRTDKFFLAFAQYNGITAIILSLIVSQWVPEVVSVIAIAVVVINTLYYVTNWVINKKLH